MDTQINIIGMIDATKLNLSQVKQKIQIEKEDGVKKWLAEHGIRPKKHGREKLVFEFSVDLALQIELVEDLIEQYPDNWFKLYAAKSKCDKMTKAIFELYPPKKKTDVKRIIKPYTKRIS